MNAKKILITGYKGFVGTTFTQRLHEHDLTLIDLKDGNDAIDFFRQSNEKFDLIVHLAAFVGGRKAFVSHPTKLFNNFALDASMFEFCLRTRPDRVIYYSSSAAYPKSYQDKSYIIQPLDEHCFDLEHMYTPDPSIYGLSKLVGEHLAEHARSEGLNVYVFRPFSGYGEHQTLDYPFPSFINRIKTRQDPFVIWGNGEQTRDFIHIDDIVDGTLAVIKKADNVTVNLCTGVATSFNELAEQMFDISGFRPEIKHLTSEPVGVIHRVGDPTYMHTFYEPKISLEQGIIRSLNA